MKATLTVTRRGVVMLPIEICTDERVAEFDREERALAKPMRARAPKRR